MKEKKTKVAIALSGGIDSAVAAAILKNAGYELAGIAMQVWDGWKSESAYAIAKRLDIPFFVFDCKKEFEKEVVNYFVNEYLNGRTPNPCILCNQEIKFGILSQKARELGFFSLATGHYANIKYDNQNQRYNLFKGCDFDKDQSYFLFSLTQKQLSQVIFPLGKYTKNKVRKLSKRYGFEIFKEEESQEICFIPDRNYSDFIMRRVPPRLIHEGLIVDLKGKVIGRHKGIPFYTIGQRKGLGVSNSNPLYVVKIDAQENLIVLGEKNDLEVSSLIIRKLNWIAFSKLESETKVMAKMRYRQQEVAATVMPLSNDKVMVQFDVPQQAITPGQAAVFYQEDLVVGGGWIERVVD